MLKPIYVGTSVLELSKLTIMKFHYDVIHAKFEGNYNLSYSDTDSLVYDIRHPDIHDCINQNKEQFDLTESMRTDLKDDTNDKVVGKFKDAMHGLVMTEFLALNPQGLFNQPSDLGPRGQEQGDP